MTHALLRPSARVWHATQLDRWRAIPRPHDDPIVDVPGDDADRVLLIGDGAACGYGVVSHHLALAGALARRLAHATGRGARVEVVTHPRLFVGELKIELERLELRGMDAIVVTTGIGDACRLTSIRSWQHDVRGAVDAVVAHARRDTPVLWLGIPSVRAIPVFRGVSARIIEHHAALLNRQTRMLLDDHPRAQFVPFEPDPHRDGERHRSAATFSRWADLVTPSLHRALDEQVEGPVAK
ncbi:hypothetical protein [Diaminobutyricimonas aerilata]|nr:hypothetical protein [Diaminobutyricimonas aerilata]